MNSWFVDLFVVLAPLWCGLEALHVLECMGEVWNLEEWECWINLDRGSLDFLARFIHLDTQV